MPKSWNVKIPEVTNDDWAWVETWLRTLPGAQLHRKQHQTTVGCQTSGPSLSPSVQPSVSFALKVELAQPNERALLS